MKSSEICKLAIEIVAWQYGQVNYRGGYDTYYDDTNADTLAYWNGMTWWDGAWHADCLGFIRAVLCGWHDVKSGPDYLCGGADRSYGCFNFSESMFLDSCLPERGGGGVTYNDFSNIVPCSLLYKQSPFGHVGIYVGEFQLAGQTYNTCECTTSYGDPDGRYGGGRPAWVDPDGTRRPYKGASSDAGKWLAWGIFNTGGSDYGLTEYDGGAQPGATGFGTALTETEVNYYFPTIMDASWLTYDYVENIAANIHGMSADVFAVMAGWGWGEEYSFAIPRNWDEPDHYMGYLCDCVPVNYYEGLGRDTGQSLADEIKGGGGAFYDYSAMVARAADLKASEATNAGKLELTSLLLALLNPNQDAWFCYGPLPSGATEIYQQQYGETIYVFYTSTRVPYDITGTGIRGGWTPFPPRRMNSILTMIKPVQLQNFYRLPILLQRR